MLAMHSDVNRMVGTALLSAVVLLGGCQDGVVAPDDTGLVAPSFAKGGGKGPPGGDPPSDPDPAIAFRRQGALRVMNADGTNVTELVSDAQFYANPSWYPAGDGSSADPFRIVFPSQLCGPLATVNITVVNGTIDATPPSTITTGDECSSGPAWSPDQTIGEIAYVKDSEALVTIPAMDPAPNVTILYTGPAGGALFDPTWSPSGDAIAFYEWDGSDMAIKIFHRSDGSISTVVDFGDFLEFRSVDWGRSEENQKLAFTVTEPKGRKLVRSVYTLALSKDASGHYTAAGTPLKVVNANRASWSPDDGQVATDGIDVFDLATGETQALSQGEMPDWRRF